MLKIVVAGEVDCGKSTLIGRLLYDSDSISLQAREEFKKVNRDLGKDLEFAFLLDSFEEERKNEFTLDTTQAFLKAKGKEFLLIDIPGHRELLTNMLTGTSYADAAVLVVDPNKPLEEQTRRHLFLLNFLGIEIRAVLVNKMDTVGFSEGKFKSAKEQIESALQKLNLKVDNLIPVSAKTGENLINRPKLLDWYQGPAFIETLLPLEKKEKVFDFRFPVQDVYEINKEKVLMGMVASGTVRKGDLLKSLPLGAGLKVRAVKKFEGSRKNAGPGESIGLVPDIYLEKIKRAQVIYKGNPPLFLNKIKAKIFCLDKIKAHEGLTISCCTQEACGKLISVDERIDTADWLAKSDLSVLEPADAATVTIETDRPLAVEKFRDLPSLGKIVLKKDNKICAIGIID